MSHILRKAELFTTIIHQSFVTTDPFPHRLGGGWAIPGQMFSLLDYQQCRENARDLIYLGKQNRLGMKTIVVLPAPAGCPPVWGVITGNRWTKILSPHFSPGLGGGGRGYK